MKENSPRETSQDRQTGQSSRVDKPHSKDHSSDENQERDIHHQAPLQTEGAAGPKEEHSVATDSANDVEAIENRIGDTFFVNGQQLTPPPGIAANLIERSTLSEVADVESSTESENAGQEESRVDAIGSSHVATNIPRKLGELIFPISVTSSIKPTVTDAQTDGGQVATELLSIVDGLNVGPVDANGDVGTAAILVPAEQSDLASVTVPLNVESKPENGEDLIALTIDATPTEVASQVVNDLPKSDNEQTRESAPSENRANPANANDVIAESIVSSLDDQARIHPSAVHNTQESSVQLKTESTNSANPDQADALLNQETPQAATSSPLLSSTPPVVQPKELPKQASRQTSAGQPNIELTTSTPNETPRVKPINNRPVHARVESGITPPPAALTIDASTTSSGRTLVEEPVAKTDVLTPDNQASPAQNVGVTTNVRLADRIATDINVPGMKSEVDAAALTNRVASAIHSASSSGRPLRMRLSPPELGTLQVEISVRQGAVMARLEVDNAVSQKILLDNIASLRESLAQNGTQLERIEVHLSERNSGQTTDHFGSSDQRTEQEFRERLNEQRAESSKETDDMNRRRDAASNRPAPRSATINASQIDIEV